MDNDFGAVKKNQLAWLSEPGDDHVVHFYTSQRHLLVSLRKYIARGLKNGDTCLVIAKPAHREALENWLRKHSPDYATACAEKSYISLDAAHTLNTFMVNGLPDERRFFEVIGGLARTASQNGAPMRAYGEMVALLWEAGNQDAVLQLENLWNRLADQYAFSLYCAYPELHFIMHNHVMEEIKQCHSQFSPA